MNLTEMTIAAKMHGMSYRKYAYLLQQDAIPPPNMEEIRAYIKNVNKPERIVICQECGEKIIGATGRRKFCSTNCKVKHHNKRIHRKK